MRLARPSKLGPDSGHSRRGARSKYRRLRSGNERTLLPVARAGYENRQGLASQCGCMPFCLSRQLFKQCESGRFVIVSVVFRLPKRWQPRCAYPEIERILAERGIVKPSLRDVFDAVVAARQSKLPDPAQAGNAGSFFKNPLLRPADFEALSGREPDLAAHPLPNGQIKLAAGQLIERCGWKGRALGRAAVHARHALVIINNGNACGADILKLAEVIQRDVYRRFGVRLEPEPTII